MGRKTALKAQNSNSPKQAPVVVRQQGAFGIMTFMEKKPDTENVAYIDEYPHLEEKLRLQRLARPAVSAALRDMTRILKFERPDTPDGVA